MIYDSFLFYNELELLDIRLNTLNDVIDKFVITEGTVTHTNKAKPLFYEQNKDKFRKFHKKIIHIIVKDNPNVSLPWIIERHQLEATKRGLLRCNPNDVILNGPVDEIPKPEKILEWKNRPGRLKTFLMKLCFYYLNCVAQNVSDWEGTRMFSYKDLVKFKEIYFTRYLPTDTFIPDGGWHFSYMGGLERIRQKIQAMAHQEFNTHEFNSNENILKAIANRQDFMKPGIKFAIENDSILPEYAQKNKNKFAKLIANKNTGKYYPERFWNIYWETKKYLRDRYVRFRQLTSS